MIVSASMGLSQKIGACTKFGAQLLQFAQAIPLAGRAEIEKLTDPQIVK